MLWPYRFARQHASFKPIPYLVRNNHDLAANPTSDYSHTGCNSHIGQREIRIVVGEERPLEIRALHIGADNCGAPIGDLDPTARRKHGVDALHCHALAVIQAGGEAAERQAAQLGSRTVTVRYRTLASGAGLQGAITPTEGSLVFAPGERSKTLVLQVSDDQQVEPDEQFSVRLESATNAQLGTPATATVTIRNDDLFWRYLPVLRM